MSRNYYTGKYRLGKAEYLSAKYYALRYEEWRDEYNALADPSIAIRYDIKKVQTSRDFDITSEFAERRAELSKKMKLIEETAMQADSDLYQWLIKGVTEFFATYNYLHDCLGMPCSKDMYSDRRRKFYYLLSKKI